jgi:ABC-type nitrate/sulfonate/bicarbonate transport system permease component
MTTAAAPAQVAPRGARPGDRRFWDTTFPRVLAIVLFLGTWQLLVPRLPTVLIPTPVAIVQFMVAELRGDTVARASVYESFAITFARLAVGLLATFVFGITLGVAMGVSKRVDAIFRDFVIGGLAMPYVIWALIAALWFGFTFKTPVIVVVLAAVPFVISNVAEGVRAVPKDLVDMGRAFGVGRARVVRRVVIPSLMPFLFAAFRYALSLGWKALAVAEVFGASSGAGWVIRFWYDSRRMTGLFAYLGFFVIFAILIDVVVLKGLANRVFRWRPTAAGRMA